MAILMSLAQVELRFEEAVILYKDAGSSEKRLISPIWGDGPDDLYANVFVVPFACSRKQ
jgi:hypothetical protein